MSRLLWLASFAFGLGVALPSFAQSPGNFSTLSTSGTATLGGDLLICSGRPWIDVRCNGATGDDSHDDTTAINTTVAVAITNNWPVHFPAGTYKVTSPISIDYAGLAAKGFRLISEAATIDGRTIASGPVLQIRCGGGSPTSPTGCFYFKEEGTLFVNADTPGYAVVFGNTDFSDAHNSAKIDHLSVNNTSTAPGAGGCQFNFVLDSDIYAVCVSAGGAAGLAFEQTQFSRLSGAGTAAGTGGSSLVLENGYNFSNTFFALDLEVSPTCLAITFDHNGLNTFVSPYFNCTTAVNATASIGNVLINPNYGGATVNFGPSSTGLAVIGSGSRSRWYFPSAASYTAAAIDDGINISSYNTPGASLTVTLPRDYQPQPRLDDRLRDRQRQGHDRRRSLRGDPGGQQEPCLGNSGLRQLRVSPAAVRRQQLPSCLGDAEHASHQRFRPAAVAQQLALSVDLGLCRDPRG